MSVASQAPAGRRSALVRLIITELRLFTREPLVFFWAIVFPLLLLVVFGVIPAFKTAPAGYRGLTLLDAYVPILIVMMLALLSLVAMPTVLAGYREQGILRRLQTTPAAAFRVLAAQLLVNFGSAVVMVCAILLLGRLAFSVPFPLAPAVWAVVALLAAVGLMSLGLFIAAVAPSGRAASVIGSIVFYPLMFFSGLWLPIPSMPSVLQHISHATPLGATWESFQYAALGHWPPALGLLTMVAYGAIFGLAAARLFRWQ